jgi:hypothetical protein
MSNEAQPTDLVGSFGDMKNTDTRLVNSVLIVEIIQLNWRSYPFSLSLDFSDRHGAMM